MLFLIEYDRAKGQIVTLRSFSWRERENVENARLELELELNRLGEDHEIVILEAETENALRKTHRRYFEDLDDLVRAS